MGLPGRKSDVSDASWLCQLPECGLLRSSQPQSSTGVYRCGRPVQLRHDFVYVDRCLLRRCWEPALDTLLHPGYEDAVTEPLPTFLRVVGSHDRPTAGRSARGMVDLTVGQTTVARVNGADRCFVVLFRAPWEMMNDRNCPYNAITRVIVTPNGTSGIPRSVRRASDREA